MSNTATTDPRFATFAGRYCVPCSGTGNRFVRSAEGDCPHCSGTGDSAAVRAAVAAGEPAPPRW